MFVLNSWGELRVEPASRGSIEVRTNHPSLPPVIPTYLPFTTQILRHLSHLEDGYIMPTMRVRKFLHSCLLLEKGEDRLLFDPGKFSFIETSVRPADFTGLKAVIITHAHPDHMDDEALKVIMQNNPEASLLSNAGVASA